MAGPLPWKDAKAILARVGGPDVVLVGGQAVAFWAAHYGPGFVSQHGAPPVTTDIDLLGDRMEVPRAGCVSLEKTGPGGMGSQAVPFRPWAGK
jgi:hypothetical protein